MRPIDAAILAALCLSVAFAEDGRVDADRTISLAGNWGIILDPQDRGLPEHWHDGSHAFPETIRLPGTTDEAGLGIPAKTQPPLPNTGVLRGLQRKVSFVGPVWYRRPVEIPAGWAGQEVSLELERVIWESRVWLDGHEVGSENSLSTRHRFSLAGCTPGKHDLIIRVDNRQQIEIGKSHAYIDDTQTKWNGIVGRLELHADPPVHMTAIRADNDPGHPSVRIDLRNTTAREIVGSIQASSATTPAALPIRMTFKAPPGDCSILIPLDACGALPAWDEFHPNLMTVRFTLDSELGLQQRDLTFGLRSIKREGTSLRINGRPLFLRGTHEGCSFPLTGYPPMDTAAWRTIFRTVKEWGLNHVRFHSYCPPEACFAAADAEGVYLQIELPLWIGKIGAPGDDKRCQWIHAEAMRILTQYGNHPSIILMALGNELEGEFAHLEALIQELQQVDPRRLYSISSNRLYARMPANAGKPGGPAIHDDFQVERLVGMGLRGQIYFDGEPTTANNFSRGLASTNIPVITHEAAQWCLFPNIAEIPKYTGVLRPANLEAIHTDLKAKGMLAQAADFTRCSGRFSFELDKQELELALRSRPLSGYQLLDLHDYPGQGTAHVGLLDSFWESKGVASPAAFREACAPVVPLALLPRRVFGAGDTLSAKVEAVNYSELPLHGVTPTWSLTTPDGTVLRSGTLGSLELPLGAGHQLGEIRCDIPDVARATEATLRIRLPEVDRQNSWRIWIYPAAKAPGAASAPITTSFPEAVQRLQQGGRVLYCPNRQSIKTQQDAIFLPAFWSPVYFSKQAGTHGLVIRPEHPALADFPTADHTDWQWWYPLRHSAGAVILDGVDPRISPVVQAIPSFSKIRKLGLIFEVRVGDGRLLVCTINLTRDLEHDPVRRQLRDSLLSYISKPPDGDCAAVSEADLGALFQDSPDTPDNDRKPTWSKDQEPPPPVKKAGH